MSQSVEKEFFAPACLESFAACRRLVGSHLEDICGEPAHESKISWRVIFSISSQVLVEYDVLLPMTSVLNVPMLSNDIEHVQGRETPRSDEQALLAAGFAVDGALGDNPSHTGE